MDLPLMKEINLEYILDRMCKDFKEQKTILGEEVFSSYSQLNKIRKGKRPLTKSQCSALLARIQKDSGSTKEGLRYTLIRWFPDFADCKDVEQMKEIVAANLLGYASESVSVKTAENTRIFLSGCMKEKKSFPYRWQCKRDGSGLKTENAPTCLMI
jgi:hypothetical protein